MNYLLFGNPDRSMYSIPVQFTRTILNVLQVFKLRICYLYLYLYLVAAQNAVRMSIKKKKFIKRIIISNENENKCVVFDYVTL